MSLIQCPECQKEISEKAQTCPNCGFPIAVHLEEIAYNAEVKRLTDKIIPVEYKCPVPRVKVCIKCGEAFWYDSENPDGKPFCSCNYNGKPYPGVEVDYSTGGKTPGLLGSLLYIQNQCIEPMNIGDSASAEYKSRLASLMTQIENSEKTNFMDGRDDWKIQETPPDPINFQGKQTKGLNNVTIKKDCIPKREKQIVQDSSEEKDREKPANSNRSNPAVDLLKSRLEKCKKDIDKTMLLAIIMSALTIVPWFIDGLAVLFIVPGFLAFWFWVKFSDLTKYETELYRKIKLAEKDYDMYVRASGSQTRVPNINAKKQQGLEQPTCPICKSRNTHRISTANRVLSVSTLGLASSKIGKQYECKDCKHKW